MANTFLLTVLYVVAIVLLVVLIVVAFKLIKVLDKIDRIADNVEDKVNSFNGAISVMKTAADGIANISDTVVFGVSSAVSKLVNKFVKKKEEYEDE